MLGLSQYSNPYGDDKVIAACSLFGAMDQSGRRFSGSLAASAIANMHDRGNGLGGGFAGYGLYPEFASSYCFHIMYMSKESRLDVEEHLGRSFRVHLAEELPTRRTHGVRNPPSIWRYFLDTVPVESQSEDTANAIAEEEFIVEQVMKINTQIRDSFVFSSGKNMGVFKGVGFPEDIAEHFRLDEYRGYIWTAHGRFPTNTSGWWGGAHPFSVLDWTVVHNGEISSYGINRRYLEMHGYACTMQTDTEVVAYAADLLMRRHRLPVEIAAKVLASPFWSAIDRMSPAEQTVHRALRQVYGSILLNGPFTVIICRTGEMIGLTDRIRLRPLTVATSGDMLFLSSEEAAIRLVCRDLDSTWIPMGGVPIIGRLKSQTAVHAEGVAVAAAAMGGLT